MTQPKKPKKTKKSESINLLHCTHEEACDQYAKISDEIKELEMRAELLKSRLKMDMVKDDGVEWFSDTACTQIRVEKRVGHHPDKDKVLSLLKEKNIDPSKVMQKVEVEVVDGSKLEALVQLGFITQAEVDSCRKVSIALYYSKK